MIPEMNLFLKEVVEKSLEKHSKCGQQQGPSMRPKANSGIFRSLLCVPRVRGADVADCGTEPLRGPEALLKPS